MTSIDQHKKLVKTARIAGMWYLLMAISGILGFLVFHPQVYVAGDAQATLTNLMDHTSMARMRLLLEIAIVITQALTAVWFYQLFRSLNESAAWAAGVWGTVNAVVIMISAIAMGVAIDVAGSAQAVADTLPLIELLTRFMKHAWGIGGLFFGLWLIPLGYSITSTRRMPIWLGRVLIAGGIGYIVSTILNYAGVASPLITYLTLPATIGEFWMIGYLFAFGIRPEKAYS